MHDIPLPPFFGSGMQSPMDVGLAANWILFAIGAIGMIVYYRRAYTGLFIPRDAFALAQWEFITLGVIGAELNIMAFLTQLPLVVLFALSGVVFALLSLCAAILRVSGREAYLGATKLVFAMCLASFVTSGAYFVELIK